VSRRVKDAIVDRQRDSRHRRSDVNADDPDVQFNVHLVKDQASLYVDLAGDALHRRGYRTPAAQAPLKETLASALIRLSRWDRQMPLGDPCCGSGTLAFEAALMVADWAPGLSRSRFGLERHVRMDAQLRDRFNHLRQTAWQRIDRERARTTWTGKPSSWLRRRLNACDCP